MTKHDAKLIATNLIVKAADSIEVSSASRLSNFTSIEKRKIRESLDEILGRLHSGSLPPEDYLYQHGRTR